MTKRRLKCVLNVNQTLELGITSNNTGGGLVYKSANNSVAVVDDKGIVTGKKRGAVKIWITSENGQYSDFVYLVVKNPVGNKTMENGNIRVYPNPVTNERLTVEVSKIDEKVIWSLYGVNGTLISKGSIDNERKAQINMEGWKVGMYLLNLKSDSGSYVHKVIKR